MANEPRARVLIVEDEPDMNNLLADVLSVYGFEPIQASSGEEALSILAQHPPDAILLDLMLPGLSGLELCQRLKTSRQTRTIPIVILTALDRGPDRHHGYETGADDYLTKPFTPEGLVARLQSCLDACREARLGCAHLKLSFDLDASIGDLKAVNTLATCLYCHTDFTPPQIEALRAGLMTLSDDAGKWAAAHRGASPIRMSLELEPGRLQLKFRGTVAEADPFLAEHLDPEASMPAAFTDAGLIDRITRDGGEIVLEKAFAPPAEAK